MDQLLVALDVESGGRALDLAESLRHLAGGFKIGSRLFTLEGPRVVKALTRRGHRVFLDLKFHDIPNTVAAAAAAATSLGVWMFNVHAAGGVTMMAAAVEAARDAADRQRRPAPLVIAVTVLTSMNQQTLGDTGVRTPVLEQVVHLAKMTKAAGLDGVVASAQETSLIRQACGAEFVVVTPGIRGGSAETSVKDDQERTMTAPEAIAAGATYIVVGRPIIAAADPRRSAEAIVQSLSI